MNIIAIYFLFKITWYSMNIIAIYFLFKITWYSSMITSKLCSNKYGILYLAFPRLFVSPAIFRCWISYIINY